MRLASKHEFWGAAGADMHATLNEHDRTLMERCIALAGASVRQGELPFAALVCQDGVVVAEATNRVARDGDVTRHAELLAVSEAQRTLRAKRLKRCTPAWCTDQGSGCTDPHPGPDHAVRTELGRPSSSMRLSTWAATSTSVARRSSVCARNRSPITCFHLAMAASARARFGYPDTFCQAMRPCSAMCWRWRSRCVGALSAVWLGTAVARGGATTSASGGRWAALA